MREPPKFESQANTMDGPTHRLGNLLAEDALESGAELPLLLERVLEPPVERFRLLQRTVLCQCVTDTSVRSLQELQPRRTRSCTERALGRVRASPGVGLRVTVTTQRRKLRFELLHLNAQVKDFVLRALPVLVHSARVCRPCAQLLLLELLLVVVVATAALCAACGSAAAAAAGGLGCGSREPQLDEERASVGRGQVVAGKEYVTNSASERRERVNECERFCERRLLLFLEQKEGGGCVHERVGHQERWGSRVCVGAREG